MSKSLAQEINLSIAHLKGKNKKSKTRLRVWLHLLKTSKLIENELKELLRLEFNTTLPRFDVMAALYRFEKGLKMSRISGVLKISNGNVTGIVDRLAKEGSLVRVSVKGDRRVQLVKLTRKGREKFADMAEKHEGWINEMMPNISVSDAEDLIEQLDMLHSDTRAGTGEK